MIEPTSSPHLPKQLGVKEGDILATTGWLHLVAAENDGDYHHIQINDSKDSQMLELFTVKRSFTLWAR